MQKDYSNLLGRRFFKHTEDDNLIVYKVISFASYDKARVIDINNPDKTFKIPYEELLKDYNMLLPDGNIVFNIVGLNDNIEDVIVAMFKNNTNIPYCVARQNIINIYNDFIKKYDNLTSVGMCMSLDTIPDGIDYRIMLSCNEALFQTSVAYYMDDTLNDILRCIKKKDMYDTVLNNLYIDNCKKLNPLLRETDKVDQLESYGGYNRTLESFLKMTDFMSDVRKGFDIKEIKGIINVDENGVYTLSKSLLDYLEYELGYKLKDPVISVYNKYIDTKLISRDYIIICDESEKMYIIVYDK